MTVTTMRKPRMLVVDVVRTASFRRSVVRAFERFAGLKNSHK